MPTQYPSQLALRLKHAESNPYGVKPGDVVKSNDPRGHGIKVRITHIEGPYAFTDAKGVVNRIRLDRFNPNRRDNYSVVTEDA